MPAVPASEFRDIGQEHQAPLLAIDTAGSACSVAVMAFPFSRPSVKRAPGHAEALWPMSDRVM
jgi:tRNA A37 threonylcarbamoyladenosine modification protein TsaB